MTGLLDPIPIRSGISKRTSLNHPIYIKIGTSQENLCLKGFATLTKVPKVHTSY